MRLDFCSQLLNPQMFCDRELSLYPLLHEVDKGKAAQVLKFKAPSAAQPPKPKVAKPDAVEGGSSAQAERPKMKSGTDGEVQMNKATGALKIACCRAHNP